VATSGSICASAASEREREREREREAGRERRGKEARDEQGDGEHENLLAVLPELVFY